jgi:hypothetical protein
MYLLTGLLLCTTPHINPGTTSVMKGLSSILHYFIFIYLFIQGVNIHNTNVKATSFGLFTGHHQTYIQEHEKLM